MKKKPGNAWLKSQMVPPNGLQAGLLITSQLLCQLSYGGIKCRGYSTENFFWLWSSLNFQRIFLSELVDAACGALPFYRS